jgi:uncharacterized protein involved in outer membrane biogenesis
MPNAIGKTIRYSFIVLLLLIGTLLAAPFFIDVNDYKTEIEQGVEDATGRKLSIGGISISLFPWIGVQLDDVKLANRAGFSSHDLLAVQRLHIKLVLLPLLNKEVEIKQFEVVSPRVYLERHSNGETNWGDLIASDEVATVVTVAAVTTEPQVDNSAAPLLAALKAESISLSDGEFVWADEGSEPVVLSDLDLLLQDVQLERPISVHIDGKLSGNAFNIDARVGPLGNLEKFDLARLPVQGQLKVEQVQLYPFKEFIAGWPEVMGDIANATAGVTANLELHPDGMRMGEGTFSIDGAHNLGLNWKIELLKEDQLEVRRASLAVDGKDVFTVKGSVKALTTVPTYQLRLEGLPLERIWLTEFVPDLDRMYAGHPAPWKQLKFDALVAGGSKHVDIRDLQLMLDGEFLQASGSIIFDKPDIRLRITAKTIHLDPWLPQGEKQENVAEANEQAGGALAGISMVGEAQASEAAAAEPDLRFLKPWVITAKMRVNTMFMRGLEMKNFQAVVSGSGGRIDLNPLSFGLSGGKVVEKVSLDVNSYPVSWKESANITGVQIGPLLKVLADMNMLEGTMEMNTSLRATGLTEAAISSLNGQGNVMLRNGKIRGFDVAGAIRRFVNPGAVTGPQETDFAQLSGKFTVKNGVADNKDLFMASPLLRVTGHGTVDLVQKLLDYHIKPRVVGTLKGQGDAVPLRKGLSVPLYISGPFENLKIQPEINAKTLIENAPALLNKGKIGRVLDKILGGKKAAEQGAPAGSAQPEEPQPARPIDKIRQGLRGLIPGL